MITSSHDRGSAWILHGACPFKDRGRRPDVYTTKEAYRGLHADRELGVREAFQDRVNNRVVLLGGKLDACKITDDVAASEPQEAMRADEFGKHILGDERAQVRFVSWKIDKRISLCDSNAPNHVVRKCTVMQHFNSITILLGDSGPQKEDRFAPQNHQWGQNIGYAPQKGD